MNDMERIIWGSAFATEIVRLAAAAERAERDPQGIDALRAVDVADLALEKYREAIAAPPGDSGVAFYPKSEGWPWAAN